MRALLSDHIEILKSRVSFSYNHEHVFKCILVLQFALFIIFCDGCAVIGQSTSLLVSPSLAVENSHCLKPGTKVVCERVDIRGLSRLHNLKKFAHSVKVKVLQNSSSLRRPNVEVCFHRWVIV